MNRTMLFYIMRNYFISRLASTRLFSPPLFDRYFLPTNRPGTIHISFYLFRNHIPFNSSLLPSLISFFHFDTVSFVLSPRTSLLSTLRSILNFLVHTISICRIFSIALSSNYQRLRNMSIKRCNKEHQEEKEEKKKKKKKKKKNCS